MSTVSDYSIQLRDKNSALKQYLTPFVSKVSWEWNRIGGCGRCSLIINKAYRDIIFDAKDDIQIRARDIVNFAWDSYTKLMLHCDGVDAATTFTDEIGKDVTANGNAQIDTAQKKFGTASGLFDGTGDYLSLADSDDWNFGAGDFTFDFRVRFGSVSVTNGFFGIWAVNKVITMYVGGGTLQVLYSTDGSNQYTPSWSWSPSVDTWYHVALIRNGNNLNAYVAGTSLGNAADMTGHSL